jgi:hypothetical protein
MPFGKHSSFKIKVLPSIQGGNSEDLSNIEGSKHTCMWLKLAINTEMVFVHVGISTIWIIIMQWRVGCFDDFPMYTANGGSQKIYV